LNGKWRIATFNEAAQPQRERRQRAGRHHREPQRSTRAAIFDYYDLLGVAYDADLETVKREYRRLALQFHPDYNKSPDATERMQAINTAYAKIVEYLGESG
jgi:DnaJ-domain-containing protein 1